MASPLRLLRAGPPPPKVAMLPDALFFTRTVPISPGATAAEVTTQVELALETLSPFPLAQLYYGWFWPPGAEQALVFAAYRRRFTTEQAGEWQNAELVMPAFGAALGTKVQGATTIFLDSAEGVTAVHWESGPVPAKVVFRPVSTEATEENRAVVRDELLRGFGGSRKVIDVTAPLLPEAANSDRELHFRSGDVEAELPAAVAAAIDVRDKTELAALRGARKRDVLLWRVALGCAATVLLLILGEFALIGARMWNDVRVTKVRVQKTTVDKIMASQALANRIDEIATKRLLPFEMITQLFEDNRKPAEILFRNVIASTQVGINTLTIEAFATNSGLVPGYIATLRKLPMISRVEDRDFRTRGDTATFVLVVTFKPDSLKPAEFIASQ